MLKLISTILLVLQAKTPPATAPIAATTQPVRNTMPDTWAGTDGLGREMPTEREVGPPRSGKFVGIFYFTWLGQHGPGKVFDLSEIRAHGSQEKDFGPVGAFHWWGRPYFDYYRSDDRWVIRKHAQQLADAGVDVIIIDATNGLTYDPVVRAIGEVFSEIRAAGGRTPQIAFIVNAKHVSVVKHLYDTLYAKGIYKELWFEWDGKPLILADSEGVPQTQRDFFTFRRSWAFTDEAHRREWMGDGREKWPWIDRYPQGFGWRDDPSRAEAVPVAIATHPIANVGRSNDGHAQPPSDQLRTAEGIYFAKQWERALQLDPSFIFVTGWNEWVAQRFLWGKPTKVDWIGDKRGAEGDSFFVDELDQEFSRDAEPMRDGHGDAYYYQLAANIRRFKGARPPPAEGPPKTIAIDGDFRQWNDVSYVYLDDIGDVAHRDHAGFDPNVRLLNTSGRNDIESVRVAWDETNVYFYVRCFGDVVQPQDQSRLWLFIRTDATQSAGWNGFDLIVNRLTARPGRVSIERLDANFTATSLGEVTYRQERNDLHLAVPRRWLEQSGHLRFDFKWADNLPDHPTAMDFIDEGDAAPNGRFRYRFDQRN